MASFKSTFLKFPFVPVFTGMFFALFLASCGQNGDRQTTISAGAQDNFSSPIPAQLEKARPGLTATVIVDGGTANARTIPLQIVNDQVQGTIPDLPVGQHTFEIQYFIDGVLVATATVNANIQAGTATPVTFGPSFTFPDADGDGASNLNEVEIFGSGSNAWNDNSTKPEISVVANPDTAILPINGVQTFTAAVAQNLNQGVTWSLGEPTGGGSITPGGTYTAGATPGTFNVVATSQADSTKSTTIPVTVVIPGSLDLTFDTDGTVTTTIGTNSFASSLAVQQDGKIIAAGNSNIAPGGQSHFTLFRYNTDGSRDNSFDTDGIVNTIIGTSSFPAAVAIQQDRKIIAAGNSNIAAGGQFHFTLARYNPDGSLDSSFDTDGIVNTVLGTSSSIAAVAVLADGKIIAVGNSNFTASQSHFTLVRYNPNGSRDTAFDSDGIVTTVLGTNSFPSSIGIQSDGKIVVAGQSNLSSAQFHFTLTRYNPNGSLDTSFDADGIITSVLGTSSSATSLGIQSDGQIVAAGTSNLAPGGQSHFTLVRYNPNGSRDNSFDSDGVENTILGTNSFVSSLGIQSDGKIIAAGQANLGPSGQFHFTLARYNSDGNLDTSFDTDGFATTILGTNSFASSLKIQGDGKIILAGQANLGPSGQFHFTLARYQAGTPPALLRANLSGDQEVPAVTTTTTTGSAVLTINPGQTEISYTLSVPVSDLAGITGVQIHLGAPGEANRSLFTPTSNTFISPLTGKLTAADLEQTAALAGIDSFGKAVKEILNGNTYIHIHTSAHQSGEIRGQLLIPAPTLSSLQAEIFKPKCAVCHNPTGGIGGAEAGLDLDSRQVSFDNLVNVQSTEAPSLKRVEPGNPDTSYLIHKLEGTAVPEGGRCCPDQMPLGAPPLSAEEIKRTRDWISAGAKND